MNYFAFTARNEQKAAAELREAGYDAFCLMEVERGKAHGNVRKSTKWRPIKRVALKGYVFGAPPTGTPDLWQVSKMTHVRQLVRFCGRIEPLPAREAQLLLNVRMPIYRCNDVPRIVEQRAVPDIRPRDVVRFELGYEIIEAPVMSVDGETLLLQLNRILLGRDTMRVPVSMVDKVA